MCNDDHYVYIVWESKKELLSCYGVVYCVCIGLSFCYLIQNRRKYFIILHILHKIVLLFFSYLSLFMF